MKISQKHLESLPTVRLKYHDDDHYITVPYINATNDVDVPLRLDHFTRKGRGIGWECGISNAVLESRDLFDHPVLYVHTIGSATYILVMTNPGGSAKLAMRYSHTMIALLDAYDKSRANPHKWKPIFESLLAKTPVAHLHPGRSEAGIQRDHDPNNNGGSHSVRHQSLSANARRMANAKLIPAVFAERPKGTRRSHKPVRVLEAA
jgi:hypothetical protein